MADAENCNQKWLQTLWRVDDLQQSGVTYLVVTEHALNPGTPIVGLAWYSVQTREWKSALDGAKVARVVCWMPVPKPPPQAEALLKAEHFARCEE